MKAISAFLSIYMIMLVTAILYSSNELKIEPLSMSKALGAERGNIKFGLYSAIPMKGSREEQIARMKELQAMAVNTVIEGRYNLGERFTQFVRDLHAHGIKLAARVTKSKDWYGPGGKGNFELSQAEKKLREASTFAEFFDYLYLAHEVHEFATHQERVRMYRLAKQYFPETPIIMYYGASIDRMEQKPGKLNHRYGPGECDIALISVGKARIDGKIDIEDALKRLGQLRDIIKQRSPTVEVWVVRSFARDDAMRSEKTSMWFPEEIRSYGRALIQSGKLDGFFFRGYGRFTYDLGYPEWEEQRRAFGSIAPMKK